MNSGGSEIVNIGGWIRRVTNGRQKTEGRKGGGETEGITLELAVENGGELCGMLGLKIFMVGLGGQMGWLPAYVEGKDSYWRYVDEISAEKYFLSKQYKSSLIQFILYWQYVTKQVFTEFSLHPWIYTKHASFIYQAVK